MRSAGGLSAKKAGSARARVWTRRQYSAPVEKGDRIGSIVYVLNGREIGSTELLAADTVERAVYGDYIGQVFRIFLL